MSRKNKIALFTLVALIQAAGLGLIISKHFTIASEGVRGRIEIYLKDPYNPLLGRYLQLRHGLQSGLKPLDGDSSFKRGRDAYLVLDRREDETIEARGLVKQAPSQGLYLRVRIISPRSGGTYFVKTTLDRYYIQDDYAVEGEKLFNDLAREQRETQRKERERIEAEAEAAGLAPDFSTIDLPAKAWAELRLLDGKAVITDLFIDGKRLAQAVDERRAATHTAPQEEAAQSSQPSGSSPEE